MDLKTLTAEALAALRVEKKTEFDGLVALESPSQEQYEQAFALADEITAIDDEAESRKKFNALKGRKFSGDTLDADSTDPDEQQAHKDPGETKPASDDTEKQVEEEEPAPAEEQTQSEQAVEEPKQEARSNVATLAAKGTRPVVTNRKPVTITAAADVPQFASGQNLDSLEEVAMAVINRAKGFAVPSGDGRGEDLRQFGTAMFHRDFEEDLVVNDPHEAQSVFHRAADETRLPGGSLTAAGGWCAPSETMYDVSNNATAEGLLSLPEVQVRRGGIRYAQSPVFADFYANPGFKQTEAQAISGTTKPCVEVTCPSFVEVRLDAVGLCIKVPILTNAAYPEIVRNFIAGTMVAHQHWVNADVLGRVQTIAGAARVATGIGSTTGDTMAILELVADQRRQQERLPMNLTMELIVPFWVKGAIRSDLELRTGQQSPVTDQQIQAYFANRKMNVQFVYDWQALPQVDVGGTAGVDESITYPATFDVLMYPAGTLVKGTAPVINLNTVYDAASLAVNTYTGLFMEEGLLVAKMKYQVDRITLPITSAGRTGAHDIVATAGGWA